MLIKIHKIEDKWYIDLKFKLYYKYQIRRHISDFNVDLLSLEFKNEYKYKYKYKVYVNKKINKLCVDIIFKNIIVYIIGNINNLYNDFFDYINFNPSNIVYLKNF